jgi:inosine/xanthosine triphosphate pyrophosphatase family protein
MKPLYFATTSDWKYKQGKQYLKQFSIDLQQAKIELPESRSEDVRQEVVMQQNHGNNLTLDDSCPSTDNE